MQIPFFLLPPEMQDHIRKQEKKKAKDQEKFIEFLMKEATRDWDLNFKWADLNAGYVCFKASTYKPELLFSTTLSTAVNLDLRSMKEILPTDICRPVAFSKEELRRLKNRGTSKEKWRRTWVYRNAILPKGTPLRISQGNRHGWVVFDGPVVTPILYEHRAWITWESPFTVWMSITPMEMFTQRRGIQHCSGVVCVGGLGLGWFLKQVHKKRSVKKIFLVEKSKEILDWYGRKMCKELPKVEVVNDDVFKWLAQHHKEVDKVALDVYDTYGYNGPEDDYKTGQLIAGAGMPRKKLWCWGSAKVGEDPETRGQFWR